jgi:hypothetical protein
MTSANVVEYRIYKDGEQVGHYRQHLMCVGRYHELLKYQPLSEHTIEPYGYDEEEGVWYDKEQNLEKFLRKMIVTDKIIKQYFNEQK